MTLSRAEILTSIETVEARQRQYRSMVRVSHWSGALTPEIRARARLTFGVLRIKRNRFMDWLTHYSDQPAGPEPQASPRPFHGIVERQGTESWGSARTG
jgi:hypothetical protein